MLFCCSLPKFGKVPKGQSHILHPKISQIVRNFSATFCATSATSLAQLLDFLSATFWGDYLFIVLGSDVLICNLALFSFFKNFT